VQGRAVALFEMLWAVQGRSGQFLGSLILPKNVQFLLNFLGIFLKLTLTMIKIFNIYKLKLIRKNNVGNFLQEQWSKYKKSKIACKISQKSAQKLLKNCPQLTCPSKSVGSAGQGS